MKRQLPRQTLEGQFLSPDTRRAPISETIRLGAQLMLQKAVELEVTEFLGRNHYQRHGDGLLRGYRNGFEDKQVAGGKAALFSALQVYLTGDKERPPYSATAAQLSMSIEAVRKAVERLRQRYGQLLRQAVAQTVSSPGEAEAELRHLRVVLSG